MNQSHGPSRRHAHLCRDCRSRQPDRGGRGARSCERSLTSEGRDYLQRCRHILANVEDAERALGQDEGDPHGQLRITAPVQFGQLHIIPALAGFLNRYKHVRTDLLLLDRNVDLVEEGIDLALRIGPLPDSSMVAVRVGEVRLIVCASPQLIKAIGIPDHPQALSALPCIRQQNLARGETSWPFRDATQDFAVHVDGRFGCNQIAAAIAACEDGLAYGRFLSYQVRQRVTKQRLRLVLEDFEPEPLPVSLVYPSGRLVSARLRALLNWLKKSLHDSDAFDS